MNNQHLLAASGIAAMLLTAGLMTPRASFGATADTPAPAEKAGVMTVTTKNYTFTVHTPEGWQGDTEAAKQYQGSVIFTPKTAAADPDGAKVLVSVHHKFDENVELSLQGDIQSYRKQFPHLDLGDLDVKHPQYQTFAKALSSPGEFYQYVAYLNPGSLYAFSFYAAMLKKKAPATPAELAAYKEIVQSLHMTPPGAQPQP